MGKLAVYKYTAMLFLMAQFIVTIFTVVGLFGGNSNPIGNTALAMPVYILPLLILANALLLVYWLIRRKWIWAGLPVVTFLCCIPYIGTMFQPRSLPGEEPAQPGLKVCTYNVANFARETSGFMAQDILSEMMRQKVDILCIQEYAEYSGDKKNSESYKEYFPFMATGNSDMVIFSRFPIKAIKNIPFEDTNNSAMWADINVKGKTIRVFNTHLETTGFNRTMHQVAKMQQHGQSVENNRIVQAIYGNYTLGMVIRAGQAITVANEKNMSQTPAIVCGDFNDVPYSFVYNTMLGNMTDGFKECGSGWMHTFRGKKAVRIDYIFHDESMRGICYYKQDLTYSDHYPVFMKLTL